MGDRQSGDPLFGVRLRGNVEAVADVAVSGVECRVGYTAPNDRTTLEQLLDEEPLNGSHAARITVRPERTAIPVHGVDEFVAAVTFECQLWGGANTPLLPVSASGLVSPEYVKILPGSAIEQVRGLETFGLYNMFEASEVSVSTRDYGDERDGFGRQLAVALLPYGKQQDYRRLAVTQLTEDDPWRGIYAACLGIIPESPSRDVLRHGYLKEELQFEGFVNLDRLSVVGSLEDLLQRLTSETSMSPRQLSMIHLRYGGGKYGRGAQSFVLPEPSFARNDAGPNIIVACSPNNADDLALLWNLRSAHGDSRPLPIGIPTSELTADRVKGLATHALVSQYGIQAKSIYVTSASVGLAALNAKLGEPDDREFKIVDTTELLTLGGPAGWSREDVIVWSDGRARFVPLPAESKKDVLEDAHFGRHTRMQVDVQVLSRPFPDGTDIRIDGSNSHYYAGANSMYVGQRRSEPVEIAWPSRLLSARAVARNRKLELTESTPGKSARVALTTFTDLWDISNLAHEPLLQLLEEMAARSGFGWLKQRARSLNREVTPVEAVGPTTDELPEKAFSDFKRALGNREKATKYWLVWAEHAGLIVKGFQLQCSMCSAKQWIPVAAFSPPIVCRGCAEVMVAPFGERSSVNFTYRISERLRRAFRAAI
jgi:ribosomal protein S27E